MPNPWLDLPEAPPYVLAADRPHVDAFNELIGDPQPQYRLDVRLVPEPVMGNRDAPLVILARNPGIAPGDYAAHREPGFVAALRANLLDDPAGHVVTALRDEFAHTPTGRWWRPRLQHLSTHCGSPEALARRILIVEFHGYHSVSWHPIGITLPSQAFGFGLVGDAVQRGATIVITRGAVDWEIAVPALRGYAASYRLGSHRNAALSLGNLGSEGFQRVIEALGGAGPGSSAPATASPRRRVPVGSTPELQRRFFTGLVGAMRERSSFPFEVPTPGPRHWIDLPLGTSRGHIALCALGDGRLRCELYSDHPQADAVFERLSADREAIETELDLTGRLQWQPLPGRKSVRIALHSRIDQLDLQEQWPDAFSWMLDWAVSFGRVFKPRLTTMVLPGG